MFTAATHLSVSHVSSPIQIGLDGLFLPTTRIKVAGARVLEPDRFDAAELHVETTTIMFADVVESVRLIEQDEVANVVRIRTFLKRVAETVVPSHNGIVLERRGDGLLIKFPDARCAASCALELHSHAAQEKMLAGERDTIPNRFSRAFWPWNQYDRTNRWPRQRWGDDGFCKRSRSFGC
jgi:hypothetical protein